MYEPNVNRILRALHDSDVVLDIGGGARPFNRANYVMDAEPFVSRGFYREGQGGTKEHFSPNTWIQRDICEHTPYPFKDKELDFVICSHTLEDVRDPLWVCAEMMRIAKCGYLEVPSRFAESCRGVEPGQVGWSHHRWLIDIDRSRVLFLMKYHMIHSHWRFSVPEQTLRRSREEDRVQWLFWEGSFEAQERTIHGVENIATELESYVEKTTPYPAWLLRLDRANRSIRRLGRRVTSKLWQALSAA